MTIGERIKLLRESKGMTQPELAEKIGTTKQNIYKYETGIVTNIPSDKIELIANLFEVSPCYIMGWEENKNSTSVNRSAIIDRINSLTDEKFDKLSGYLDGLEDQ